jgi:ferredoxin
MRAKMKEERKITRRELLKLASPAGMVTLERERCTACGLCASACPTGALAISMEGDTDAFQLLFRHGACTACERCIEICPECCLTLERTMEPGKIVQAAGVLLEGELVRCPMCGRPVGPAAMIDSVRKKVAAAGGLTSQVEMCPECKLKAMVRAV